MSIRVWSLVFGFASAAAFATIFMMPAADPGDSPKAWAHGVAFVLPRLVLSESSAFVAIGLFGILMYRHGSKVVWHPLTVCLAVLLLPAAYALVFVLRAML